MKVTRFLNLIVVVLLLVAVVLLRVPYEQVMSNVQLLPELFVLTLYRMMLAILVSETIKSAVFVFYRPTDPSRSKDNFTIGLGHISTILYGLFGVTLILSIFNISIKEAFTSLSLIAAAVVLMTKDYISNLINGMYLTFAKVITIGDHVMIDKHKGKIMDITLTNVHLLNEDDDMIYLPNNLVFTREIINYTRRELKKTTMEFEADPRIIKDVEAFEQKLIDSLAPFHADIQPGTYALKTSNVKVESITFKFQYIMKDPLNKELDKKIRRYLIREIVKLTAPAS